VNIHRVWIGYWIYWPLIHTTQSYDYSTIAISTLYKSLHTKCSTSLLCLQQPSPCNSLQQCRFSSSPHSCRYCPANIPQLNSLSQPESLTIQPQGEHNRKDCLQQFPYCCYWQLFSDSTDIISAGTIAKPLFRNSHLLIRLLHSNGCTLFFSRV
jgi:hypothetical protein